MAASSARSPGLICCALCAANLVAWCRRQCIAAGDATCGRAVRCQIRAPKKGPAGRTKVSDWPGPPTRSPISLKLRSAATILGERARGHNDQTVLTPVERSSDVARRIAKGRQPGAGVGVDFDKRSVSIGLIEHPRATVTSITAHGLFPCYGDFGRNGSMDKIQATPRTRAGCAESPGPSDRGSCRWRRRSCRRLPSSLRASSRRHHALATP